MASYTFRAFLGLAAISLLAAACTPSNNDSGAAAVKIPVVKKVTRETYLSGKQFCETYASLTGKEHGKWVEVPMDYDHPEKGSLKIYAYTNKAFDASKPSYIFVDGGPGQNTHGIMKDYLGNRYNELRFDQRGLGCSAPDNYDLYKESDLYSSENNIKDMEMIRKAYGIDKWTVYGLSYGTVPATMYGSRFPQATRAVVLEGVFGDTKKVHMMSYKLEKINLVLQSLTTAQRNSIGTIIREESDDTKVLYAVAFQLFYTDMGMRVLKKYINLLVEADGNIRRDYFARLKASMDAQEEAYPNPQQPGAIDSNIMSIIYCKNLDYRNKPEEEIFYSESEGFSAKAVDNSSNAKICNQVGVTRNKEEKYEIGKNLVKVPVYYFQGSHDGATMAIGAIEHWKTVPQGRAHFLMAQKGGHNPNLNRLESEIPSVRKAEENLLFKAMEAQVITANDLVEINANINSVEIWKLYQDPKKEVIVGDMDGIRRNKQKPL